MTLAQIEFFLEVCKTMNFTKAAQNLYISQPTLSRQIQLLETELDVTLLKRTNREVILTEAGEVFREEFSELCEKLDAAIEKVKHVSDRKNELRIGFSDAVQPMHIFDLIDGLKKWFVGMDISINQYANNDYVLNRYLENGKLDVVISLESMDFDMPGLLCSEFWELPAYIVYSPQMFPDGRKPTLEDFKDKRFVCTSRLNSGPIVRKQQEILESVGISVSEIEQVENVFTDLMYTRSQYAFSVFCNPQESILETLRLPDYAKKFKLVAYWRKNSELLLEDFFAEKMDTILYK